MQARNVRYLRIDPFFPLSPLFPSFPLSPSSSPSLLFLPLLVILPLSRAFCLSLVYMSVAAPTPVVDTFLQADILGELWVPPRSQNYLFPILLFAFIPTHSVATQKIPLHTDTRLNRQLNPPNSSPTFCYQTGFTTLLLSRPSGKKLTHSE